MFVDVLIDDDDITLAKVINETDTTFIVRFFMFHKNYYRFEPECEVDRESICGTYDESQTLESLGYTKIATNKYTLIEEETYEPSESESDCSESVCSSESE